MITVVLDKPDNHDKSKVKDDAVSKKLGYNRFMVHDVWKVGKERLLKDDIKNKRSAAKKRTERKRMLNRAIVQSAADNINDVDTEFKEVSKVGVAPWTRKTMHLFPDLYSK